MPKMALGKSIAKFFNSNQLGLMINIFKEKISNRISCYRERKRSFPDTSQFKSPDSLQLPRKYNNEKMNSNGSIMTNSSYSGVSFSKQGDDVFLRTLETSAEDQDSVFL